MKHLAILVPDGEGNNLSSIAGAYRIFSGASEGTCTGIIAEEKIELNLFP